MPFYEYQCKDCDHRLEVLQKISDEPLVYCPNCNEPSLKKLISAAAFRLKGSGWYETDFKDKPKKNGEKSDSTSTSGEGSAKSESKSSDKKTSSSATATQAAAGSSSSSSSASQSAAS